MLWCILIASSSPSEPWFLPSQWDDPSNLMKTFTHICYSTLLVLNYVPQSSYVAHQILAYWAELWILRVLPSPLWILYILACSLFCHLTSLISISLQQAMQTMQLFIHLFTASVFLRSCTSAFLPALSLPFSHRALPPTFLLPTSFLLWKQRKTEKCTYCQCLTCYYCLCLDFTAYLGERQATWKVPRSLSNAERREWSAEVSLCWGCPDKQQCRRCAELAPATPPFLTRRLHLKKAAW